MNIRDKIKQIVNDPHLIKLNDQKKFTRDDLQKILGGFDYITKSKVGEILDNDTTRMIVDIDLDIYINSQFWRIESLIKGAISGWVDNNLLSGIISLRHLYETIVHNFYLIHHLDKYINENKHKEYYFLSWNFSYAVMADFLLDDQKKDMLNKEEIKPLSHKLPHINKSLQFYIDHAEFFMKEDFKEETKKENYTLSDSRYRIASQIAHPNAAGSLVFFGETVGNKTTFKSTNKNFLFVECTFMFLYELTYLTEFLDKFILNHKKKYLFFLESLSELHKKRNPVDIINEWKIEYKQNKQEKIEERFKDKLN
tara:strand:- start:45 stop:977 length:933 start_codon:yes stop_codon:yes gene_type:complete